MSRPDTMQKQGGPGRGQGFGPGFGRGPGAAMGRPVEKAKDFKGSFRRMLEWFKPMRGSLLLVLVLTMVTTGFNIMSPGLTGQAVDVISRGLGQGRIDTGALLTILAWLVGMYVLSALSGMATGWILTGAAQKLVRTLRTKVQAKLGRLPLSWFDAHPHGDVLSRVTNDVDTISSTIQQSLSQAIAAMVQLVGFVVMMFVISWELTLVVLATLPLYVVATSMIAKRSQKHFAAQQKELGELSGHVEEMFTGHLVVKAFGQEAESVARFEAINERLAQATRRANFISGILHPAMNFIGNLGYLLISVMGGLWITNARLSIGGIVAFIQYSRNFTHPIMQTAQIANVIQGTIACAERIFEILDETEESAEPPPRTMEARCRGQVELRNLVFRYKEDEPLMEGLSLRTEPGHTVAIVGPTGAGKTTLVNLLMRFYEPRSGEILIDGIPTSSMPRGQVRSLFGMVLQDTWLFGGTIADNIAYGKTGATRDEVVEAAVAAHADHFIRTLPEGYDTVLNEEASNISQGQKQLLTIARAILADPAMLILDEATSSVDTRTEVLIQKAMGRLMEGRTSFVIAHRLSTIRNAETILVMDRGSIVEQGRHDTLLAAGGTYASLYQAQFAGNET